MLIDIHPDNPQERKLLQVVDCLRKGGLVVFPTDTVYALGCDALNAKATEKLTRLKGEKPEKMLFSLICSDVSHVSEFTRQIPNPIFRLMKKTLPGPYTYILEAGQKVHRLMHSNRKTVGVRVPHNLIATELVRLLGNPLVSSSVKSADTDWEDYPTDPEEIHELWGNRVDMVIDGGWCLKIPSTVIDGTGEEPLLVREGLGDISVL